MISEKKSLYFLIDESLDRTILGDEENNPRFKSFLKRDSFGVYSLVDADGGSSLSIKCIFSESGLKDYLKTVPSYLNFDTFENCQILLKKYRFDCLVVEVNQNSLVFRVVCYIEDFDVDGTHKISLEAMPRNINLDQAIAFKVEKVVNHFIKKQQDEYYTEAKLYLPEATSFINGAFVRKEKEEVKSVFDMVKSVKKTSKNNYLVKADLAVDDAWPYVADVELDTAVLEKVKKYDYKTLFVRNETQKDKERGLELSVSNKFRLDYTSKGMAVEDESSLVKPSALYLDVEDSAENIQQFLLKKVKRSRPTKDTANLPLRIQSLIKNYGDICANITHDVLNKYQYYQKFYNFTECEKEITKS